VFIVPVSVDVALDSVWRNPGRAWLETHWFVLPLRNWILNVIKRGNRNAVGDYRRLSAHGGVDSNDDGDEHCCETSG
ncbi:MAG TPA: hypothetical protein VFV34_12740, partial [Blastocatellia bacterium]|nr:hypothetical protein [Blastocatellia bacterium]